MVDHNELGDDNLRTVALTIKQKAGKGLPLRSINLSEVGASA